MAFVKECQQRTEGTFSREEDREAERSSPRNLRDEKLRYKRDFDLIYRRGKSVGDRYVVIFYKENRLSYTRTAFLASKKVGNSVARNRARRLMKESMRLTDMVLPEGYDFIFIARNTIQGQKCQNVQKSMESALRRTGVVKKP